MARARCSRRSASTDRRTHRPSELSGGQQQRVAVARALITRPAVVFADEPTGNLDSHASADVLALLRRAVDEFGQTVVMVTHDPTAADVADRIVELADGLIVDDRAGRAAAMTRLTLRSLASRKLRTALTAMAVVLGVAMISGTYVLTDTIDRAFGDIFQQAAEGVDVAVTPRQEVDSPNAEQEVPIDGRAARARASGAGRRGGARRASSAPSRCSTSKGEPMSTGGVPTFAASVADDRFEPFKRRPRGGCRPPTARSPSTRTPPRTRTTSSASTITVAGDPGVAALPPRRHRARSARSTRSPARPSCS